MTTNQPNRVQSLIRSIASSAPGARFFSLTQHHVDRFVFRLTGGRHTASSIFTGLPIITLTTIGAKSGQRRSLPLIGIPDGERVLIIASNWGQAHHPAWYHNLRAHPEVEVTQGKVTRPYLAQELVGEERARAREQAVRFYPAYAAYEPRTQGRVIPVIRLTPRTGTGDAA